MKSIFLLTNGKWKEYQFDKISDIKDLLTERNITIGEGSTIGEWSKIGEGSKIGARSTIGEWSTIGDKVIFKNSPLYIIGSKYIVNYYGNGKIQIGCKCHTFQEWLDKYEEIGKSERASPEVIQEYKRYIDLIIQTYSK